MIVSVWRVPAGQTWHWSRPSF